MIRWGGNVCCPHCDSERVTKLKRKGYYLCNECRQKFTVRTGTVFQRSHIPLNKWLYAIYVLETSRKGISSVQLAKEVGITQKSAWFMLHRLREACDVEVAPLSGEVEVDETWIGGRKSGSIRLTSQERQRELRCEVFLLLVAVGGPVGSSGKYSGSPGVHSQLFDESGKAKDSKRVKTRLSK